MHIYTYTYTRAYTHTNILGLGHTLSICEKKTEENMYRSLLTQNIVINKRMMWWESPVTATL